MSEVLGKIRQKAKSLCKTIVLAEGEEPRTIQAAAIISKEKIANVILVGDPAKISQTANGADLSGVEIINPATDPDRAQLVDILYQARKSKGMTLEEAEKLANNPLYYGVLLVKRKKADGMVAGAINSTGNVLRPALQIIRTAHGINTVSSCFLMVFDTQVFVFADCGVNPDPDANQLAEIAIASAKTARDLLDLEPKVALLSFSTKGSAKHPSVDKVIQATEILRSKNPDFVFDGELQADAALVESVCSLKAPGSPVSGSANILIFPDLSSGNISYKLVQRLAGAEAIGPICQGFDRPVNDLSRGCSVDDIVNVVAVTALQS